MITILTATGLITAVLTMIICLPQVSGILKTKLTQSVYTTIYITAFAASVFWILFSGYTHNFLLMPASAIAAECSGILMYLKIVSEGSRQ